MECAVANPFLSAALEAAEAAAAVIRAAYRGNIEVRYKEDASPVTDVDIAAERAVKQVLRAAFPDHGFYGEESGRDHADAEYLWLVDPIDGTKAFVRGYPVFSTQIALMHRGRIVLGVSSAPCWNGGFGETIWAARGEGAWLDGQRLKLADPPTVEKAILSTGNLKSLAESASWDRLGGLISRVYRVRGYGDFLHYHWLAAGKVDIVIESDVNILDIAALSIIVSEAGGLFTDLNGELPSLKTTTVLAATPRLHPLVLTELRYKPMVL